MRKYRYSKTTIGGCYVCNGDMGMWFANNAQGVAARHHDATGHETWVDATLHIRYGADSGCGTDATTQSTPIQPVGEK